MKAIRLPPLAKGVLISVAFLGVTYLFLNFATEFLIPPPEPGAPNHYEPDFYADMAGGARFAADNIPSEWLILFLVFWVIVGIAGKATRSVPTYSLAILAIALAIMPYFILNETFGWYYWSCFEEPDTHEGFQMLRALECPSRETTLNVLIWSPLVLSALAGLLAALHTRRMSYLSK